MRSAAMLAVTGGMIAAGMALSFYGAMIITDDMERVGGFVGVGDTAEARAVLDPSVSDEGVYVVRIEPGSGPASVSVVDPSGSQIASGTVGRESVEERFEITTEGTFTLIVENTGETMMGVDGVIGHVPDTAKFSVGITGFYLLIAGMIGIGATGIYVVKNRKRRPAS